MMLSKLLGISDVFSGFAHYVYYLVGGYFEIMFVVLVLNMSFSALKSLVLHIGGVKK